MRPLLSFTLACAIVAGSTGAPAQQPAGDRAGSPTSWRLPERGVAVYTRTIRSKFAREGRKARGRPLRRNTAQLFYDPLAAPYLFESELDEARQRSTDPPREIREVARHVALDLSSARRGRLRYELPRVLPFGDLVLIGRASAPDAAGEQTLELRIRTRDVAPRGESRGDVRRFVAPAFGHPFTGTLRVRRRLDGARGVVAGFTSELAGLVEGAPGHDGRRVRLEETWKLVAVRASRDVRFRARVADAIRRGAQWVRGWVRRVGRSASRLPVGDRSYDAGRLALALLTLLKADVDRRDEVLTAGLAELRRCELVDTYSLGLAIMALEAFYAPAGERADLISGALQAPRPRRPEPADRALLGEWTDRLLANVDARARGRRTRFNYVPGPRYDNSNTQYGLLGLYSAMLCGIEVPASVWRGAAEHFLETQRRSRAKPYRLRLTGYRDLDASATSRRGPTRSAPLATPAGWPYSGRERLAYGSMTTAGVTGLTIAEAGLHASGAVRDPLLAEADQGIRDGFAWLDTNFSVRHNPGDPRHYFRHRYYYLYGLERACELSGIARIGRRDWYFEGAMQLLAWQRKNGSFQGARGQNVLHVTCFAVLFLKKSALPVATGRRSKR